MSEILRQRAQDYFVPGKLSYNNQDVFYERTIYRIFRGSGDKMHIEYTDYFPRQIIIGHGQKKPYMLVGGNTITSDTPFIPWRGNFPTYAAADMQWIDCYPWPLRLVAYRDSVTT